MEFNEEEIIEYLMGLPKHESGTFLLHAAMKIGAESCVITFPPSEGGETIERHASKRGNIK